MGATPSDKLTLPPEQRAAVTERSFRRKVELLEAWAVEGLPDWMGEWPSTPTKLARWDDEDLGVSKWTSPNIHSPSGKYADLRKRFDEAVKHLSKRVAESKKTPRQLQARIATLTVQNIALAEQVVQMREALRRTSDELTRERSLKEQAQKRERELWEQVQKVRNLKPAT